MSNASRRPSQREILLDAALDLLRDGGSLSLDSAARAAGVTKPGLMYHFSTKEALLSALVDHLVDGYQRDLEGLLPAGTGADSATARIAAYLRWAATYVHDAADLVMLCDPKLRIPMSARWAERFRAWADVPADLPPDRRARMNAVRLLADGWWFTEATGILPLAVEDRDAVLRTALELLGGDEA
jgi:AcrR family transcriptional regulator